MRGTRSFNIAMACALCTTLLFPVGAGAAAADTEPPPVEEQQPAAKPAPVLVISSYSTSKKRLLVGSQFKLAINVRNETSRKAENVVVSLAGSDSAGNAADEGGGSGGIAVLGTGNAKYIGTVRAHTTKPVSFMVVAGGGTRPGALTIPVTVSFEFEGERHEIPYTIGLVFERAASLRVVTAEMPSTAKVGQPFDVSFELANAGSFALKGLSLSVRAQSAQVADGIAFVGAFDAAAVEGIDSSITPKRPGPLEVVFVATYQDDLGRERTFESSKTVNVKAEPKPAANLKPGDEEPKDEGNWFVRFISALFGLGS